MKDTKIMIDNMTYSEKPFSPKLPVDSTTLQELMSQRATEFTETTNHARIYKELEGAIQAIKNGSENGELLIESSINALWIAAFKAGYKAGTVDVMAAMTFNQAGITAVKYLNLKR